MFSKSINKNNFYYIEQPSFPLLNTSQKKIIALALVVIGFITTYFCVRYFYTRFKAKKQNLGNLNSLIELSESPIKPKSPIKREAPLLIIETPAKLETPIKPEMPRKIEAPLTSVKTEIVLNTTVIAKEIQQQKSSFKNQPSVVHAKILSFLDRDSNAIRNISLTNKYFLNIFNPIATASQCERIKSIFSYKNNDQNYQSDSYKYISPEKFVEYVTQSKANLLITQLDISDSQISPEQLEEILKTCPNIKKLNLWHSCNTLDYLKLLPEDLQSLRVNCYIGNNGFLDDNLKSVFRKMQKLRSLDFHSIDISDLATLRYLPETLEALDLSDCDITIEILENLFIRFKNLRSLNLSNCSVDPTVFAFLPESLESLNLDSSFRYNCTTETITALCKKLKNLRSLNLAHCTLLTPEALSHLPETLESLDLSHCSCRRLTVAMFEDVLKRFKNLRSLNLSYCEGELSHPTLSLLPERLESLYLTNCKFTDEMISDFKRLKNLRSLSLRHSDFTTAKALFNLPERLESLDLSYFKYSLNVSEITELCNKLKNLRSITLKGCNITLAQLAHLPKDLHVEIEFPS